MTHFVASQADVDLLDERTRRVGPDLPPQESPPGRSPADLDADELRIVVLALDGLTRQLQLAHQACRPGSPTYREIGPAIGRTITIANQLRRHLAAIDSASTALA